MWLKKLSEWPESACFLSEGNMVTVLRRAVHFHDKEMASKGQAWWYTPVNPVLRR